MVEKAVSSQRTQARKAIPPGPRDERGVLAARILTEARTSFAEHGFAGTTVRAIARAADVDPALVHHYYGSKENLLDAATTPPPIFTFPTRSTPNMQRCRCGSRHGFVNAAGNAVGCSAWPPR